MKIYTFKATQKLSISLEEAWSFLSDPKNLKLITPDYMGFITLSGDDRPMYPGQIIQYIVTPVLGIPTKWVTEITHVIDKKYFVDEQRFGPYSLWHHKHFFEVKDNGVLMTDLIHYALPLGFIGRIMNTLVVKNKLKTIFDYRKVKVDELFNTK
jgi:ligand-binding SRPBCC domain-containing protein